MVSLRDKWTRERLLLVSLGSLDNGSREEGCGATLAIEAEARLWSIGVGLPPSRFNLRPGSALPVDADARRILNVAADETARGTSRDGKRLRLAEDESQRVNRVDPHVCNGATASENLIGLGMWLALIMAFNVWFIIWPAQKKILGIVEATAEEKAAAAPRALYASRTNTLLSIPMLYAMVSANLG